MDREEIEFNGHTYYRYPSSPRKHQRLYFWPNRTDRKRYGLDLLHREVWKAAHGPIPEGCLIHHVNENKLDNSLENLACVTREEHGKLHPQGQPEWLIEHLDRIRPLTAEWHRSEEGREWHRQHGKASWEGRQPVKRVCVYCHQEYESMVTRENARYCSHACEQRWARDHKRYEVERTCIICGVTFSATKFRDQKTCSRKCGAAWRNKR